MSESVPESVPESLVVDPAPRPTRRSFTAAYKVAIVAEYEGAPHGEKSGVLRREWTEVDSATDLGACPRL
jgi:transposase